jgi:site-specific recombinase XerC
VIKRGKTPVLTEDQARRLLASIDTSTLIGLRDRALIGVMTYTFARVSEVVAMTVEDYYPQGNRWWVRLDVKGGKRHDMPAHHKLEAFLDEYLLAAGIRNARKSPLFRSAAGKTGSADRKADGPGPRLRNGAAAHGGCRLQGEAWLPRLPRDRNHGLSRSRRHARKRAGYGRA